MRYSDAELLRLFGYPGGKSRVLYNLYNLFTEASTYIEPFGGSYVVALNIPPSRYDTFIINDLDPGIRDLSHCYLFCPEVIKEAVRSDLHSQALFRELRLLQLDPEKVLPMLQNALLKLYLISHSVGRKGESWSYALNVKKMNNMKLSPARIDEIGGRLRRMHLFSEDFRYFIPRTFKVKNGMMYLDPPYVVSRTGKHYTLNFTKKDHSDLSELLFQFNPKNMRWLLSYQKDKIIEELYSDYYINDLEVPYSLTVQVKEGETREIKKELLISNYKLKSGFTKSGQEFIPLDVFVK